MPTPSCTRCLNPHAPHTVIDETGSTPACSLCLMGALGVADTPGVTVSVLISHGADQTGGRPR